MPRNYAGQTVAEILKSKKASIKNVALEPGSPAWDDVLDLTWEEIQERAKRRLPGYKTIKKLLGAREYDK
jgi:hypothetical protein